MPKYDGDSSQKYKAQRIKAKRTNGMSQEEVDKPMAVLRRRQMLR